MKACGCDDSSVDAPVNAANAPALMIMNDDAQSGDDDRSAIAGQNYQST
jgi:hypothetical protein